MLTQNPPTSLIDTLRHRRQKLASLIDFPAILWSGNSSPRNFAANNFPFRASSHFLYFAGLPLLNAAIRLEAGKLELFIDDPHPSSALWHGQTPNREKIAEIIGADAARPMAELESSIEGAATIAVQDAATWTQQTQLLNRWILPPNPPQGIDLELAKAIISLRLTHDTEALTELRQAAVVTVEALKTGMAATAKAKRESEIRAAMEGIITLTI